MSTRKTKCVPRGCTLFRVRNPSISSIKAVKLGWENWQAARDGHCSQKRPRTSTSKEMEHEHPFHAAADAIVCKETRMNFEQGPVTTPTSDQMLLWDLITCNPFHVGKMIKMVPKFVTAHIRQTITVCRPPWSRWSSICHKGGGHTADNCSNHGKHVQ